MGLDRPIPRGSAIVGSPIDGVVAKELMDETDEVLLLWCCWDIGALGFQLGPLYRYADKDGTRKGSVAAYMGRDVSATTRAVRFSVLY